MPAEPKGLDFSSIKINSLKVQLLDWTIRFRRWKVEEGRRWKLKERRWRRELFEDLQPSVFNLNTEVYIPKKEGEDDVDA